MFYPLKSKMQTLILPVLLLLYFHGGHWVSVRLSKSPKLPGPSHTLWQSQKLNQTIFLENGGTQETFHLMSTHQSLPCKLRRIRAFMEMAHWFGSAGGWVSPAFTTNMKSLIWIHFQEVIVDGCYWEFLPTNVVRQKKHFHPLLQQVVLTSSQQQMAAWSHREIIVRSCSLS